MSQTTERRTHTQTLLQEKSERADMKVDRQTIGQQQESRANLQESI